MISVNVVTKDVDGEKIPYLSIDNCPPAQLNSILSLCHPGMVVEISFVEMDLPNGMRSQVNN